MSLDQTQDLVSGELWLLVPVEEEACMHSRHGAKQKEHCLRVSLPSPGTSQGSPPLKCLFGERHLQALSRSCVSLTAVGEAEIVNRLRPSAYEPPI